MDRPVLLIGTASMGRDYAKVFRGRGREFVACGRDPERTREFAHREGARDAVLADELTRADIKEFAYVTVACAAEALERVGKRLLDLGARAILLEKPGSLTSAGSQQMAKRARSSGAVIRIATNRRCYGSILQLRRQLQSEAPICATFDFTEWTSHILAAGKDPQVTRYLAVTNSIHVFDTVSYLLGSFNNLTTMTAGAGEFPWHPSSATFVGSARCGETPVSWSTSWLCPGRWSIEVMTRKGRYRLAPMETLQIQRHGSVAWTEVEAAKDPLDDQYKPGLYRLVETFERLLNGEAPRGDEPILPDAMENATLLEQIYRIAGYPS